MATEDNETAQREWIYGHYLLKTHQISPGKIVNLVRNKSLLAYIADHKDNYPNVDAYAEKYGYEDDMFPELYPNCHYILFNPEDFNIERIGGAYFHIADLKECIPNILPSVLAYIAQEEGDDADPELDLPQAHREIARLTQELEALKAQGQPTLPRTAKGTKAAMDRRLEDWKEKTVVMVKVAYECGLNDRQGITRRDFRTQASKHGKLCETAIDLMKEALPGVLKTTGGPNPQGQP